MLSKIVSMRNKLDTAFAQGGDLEYPLSFGPNVVINPTVHQNISFDYGQTLDFVKSNGLPSYYFMCPLIEISDSADMPHHPDGSYVGASIRIAPMSHDEKTYFPYIRLSINQQNPSEDNLNSSFRHELAHYIHQDTSPPLYNHKQFRNTVRSIGTSALSYGALSIGFSPSLFNVTVAAACVGIGETLMEKPDHVGHNVFPRELRANYFAWRHRDFNPFGIGQ